MIKNMKLAIVPAAGLVLGGLLMASPLTANAATITHSPASASSVQKGVVTPKLNPGTAFRSSSGSLHGVNGVNGRNAKLVSLTDSLNGVLDNFVTANGGIVNHNAPLVNANGAASGNSIPVTTGNANVPVASGENAPVTAPVASGNNTPVTAPITAPVKAPIVSGNSGNKTPVASGNGTPVATGNTTSAPVEAPVTATPVTNGKNAVSNGNSNLTNGITNTFNGLLGGR